MDINNLANNDYPPIFMGDNGNFMLRANKLPPVASDWYSIAVQAGDSLTISTATPAGGPNEFVNALDPALELYDPSGTRVAWDNDSAPDLRNAQIAYTATQSGNYVVRVSGEQNTLGEYVLTVTGATGSPSPFLAVATSPGDGQRIAASPATFTVQFNDFVSPLSVENSDLLIDGVPLSTATPPSFPDGKTAVFTLPVLSEGPHYDNDRRRCNPGCPRHADPAVCKHFHRRPDRAAGRGQFSPRGRHGSGREPDLHRRLR